MRLLGDGAPLLVEEDEGGEGVWVGRLEDPDGLKLVPGLGRERWQRRQGALTGG